MFPVNELIQANQGGLSRPVSDSVHLARKILVGTSLSIPVDSFRQTILSESAIFRDALNPGISLAYRLSGLLRQGVKTHLNDIALELNSHYLTTNMSQRYRR